MKLSESRGDWALVTGASSGIGKEFASQLAAAGMNVVLVARRGELLDEIAEGLRTRHGVSTQVVAKDLTRQGAAEELRQTLAEMGIKIRLLCNNAAGGRWGRFENTSSADYEQMIHLNAAALVASCHQFLPDLSSHPTSAIVNVSSGAAYQPVPYMAVYAASKAFVHSFSQALYGEWESRGVYVQTLVPGPTATEFDAKAGAYESAVNKRGSVAEVVKSSLDQLDSHSPVVGNAKGIFKQRFFAGLFPPKMVIKEVGKMFRPPEQR